MMEVLPSGSAVKVYAINQLAKAATGHLDTTTNTMNTNTIHVDADGIMQSDAAPADSEARILRRAAEQLQMLVFNLLLVVDYQVRLARRIVIVTFDFALFYRKNCVT